MEEEILYYYEQPTKRSRRRRNRRDVVVIGMIVFAVISSIAIVVGVTVSQQQQRTTAMGSAVDNENENNNPNSTSSLLLPTASPTLGSNSSQLTTTEISTQQQPSSMVMGERTMTEQPTSFPTNLPTNSRPVQPLLVTLPTTQPTEQATIETSSQPTERASVETSSHPTEQATVLTPHPTTTIMTTMIPTNTATPITDQQQQQERRCNGLTNLCTKRFNEIMFATLHNAASTTQDGMTIFPNHEKSLELALDAGYRGINLDIGFCDGEIQLVHGFCLLGYRNPIEVFTNLLQFSIDNPHEVFILPTQINPDTGGPVSLTAIDDMLLKIPGLKERMYTHSVGGELWPTLNEMIDAKTTLVFFHYNGEQRCRRGGSTIDPVSCPQGFNDWFYHASESQFSFPTLVEFNDKEYACERTRGPGEGEGEGGAGFEDFYGVNVFTRLPDSKNCKTMNTKESLTSHIEACMELEQRMVNLLILDCWDEGAALEVVKEFNIKL